MVVRRKQKNFLKKLAEGLIPLGFFFCVFFLKHLIDEAILIPLAAVPFDVFPLAVATECKLHGVTRAYPLAPDALRITLPILIERALNYFVFVSRKSPPLKT
jgi:hypothetical protein